MFSYNLLFVPFFINKEYPSNYLKIYRIKCIDLRVNRACERRLEYLFCFNGQVFKNTKKYVSVYVYLYMYNSSRTLYY